LNFKLNLFTFFKKGVILMKIFLESGSGFQNGKDVYGNEIVGSGISAESVRSCAGYLSEQKEIRENKIEIVPIVDATTQLEKILMEDVLISLHLNFYRDSGAVGLRGFYRSTRHRNSEKCKALAITVVKGLRDHIDMYYHGVYNEQKEKHPQLGPIVHAKGLAALVEVGFKEEFKDKLNTPTVHKNIGTGLALGIIRHLNSVH
jgi:hypothetical protein